MSAVNGHRIDSAGLDPRLAMVTYPGPRSARGGATARGSFRTQDRRDRRNALIGWVCAFMVSLLVWATAIYVAIAIVGMTR